METVMRLILTSIFLISLGCKGVHSPDGAACGHGTGCAPGADHGACVGDKKDGHCLTCAKPEKKEVGGPLGAAPQEEVRQTALTQDILLIPKTVYVPYAPHV